MPSQLIIGLEGPTLSSRERRWLAAKPPLGVILFSRNIEGEAQVEALLAEVRAIAGAQVWAAIDEEGGRVNRLPWAPFAGRLHAAEYGRQYLDDADGAVRAVFEDSLQIGLALRRLGFTHKCAPVLDVFHADGHGIIGERAYSHRPDIVAILGAA